MSKKHSANGEADAESWCDGTKLLVKSEVDNPQEPPDDADAQASCEQVDGFDAILEQLSTVIGIDDVLFCRGLLKQILWMFLDNDGKFDNAQFGFVIAYLQSNKPRDRDEAAEKVLKIASQLLSMKYAERLWFAKTPQEIDIAERTYNKLVRTWLAQNQGREPERSRSTCVAIDYFSRGPFAHFDLAVRAISIRRRIASGRVNEPSCSAIQESRVARSRGCTLYHGRR